jgi:riboflavin transporter FmnP
MLSLKQFIFFQSIFLNLALFFRSIFGGPFNVWQFTLGWIIGSTTMYVFMYFLNYLFTLYYKKVK